MKFAFVLLLTLHGLIHGMGFAKAFQLAEISQLSQNISRSAGMAWLLAGLLFLLTAILFIGKNNGWWIVGTVAIVVSQALILTSWKDAKFGTIANLLVLLPVLVGFFSWKFERQIDQEVQAIFSKVQTAKAPPLRTGQLEQLPPPVQHWLEEAGAVGKVPCQNIHLLQKGRLRLAPGKDWTPFTAEQFINLDVPAFVWKAENRMMPILDVNIRDRFEEGKGHMLAKLWSAIPMVDAANEKIDEAALQRFLAEIVWAPTAALAPYIRWEALDASSAKATMEYQGVSGSVVFHFGKNWTVVSVEAQRFMDSGPDAERRTWFIEIEKNERFSGLLIPSEISLTWQLPEGDFKWMEMRIDGVEYEMDKEMNSE